MSGFTLTVTEVSEQARTYPRWISQQYGRGYWSSTIRSYHKKPRLYIHVEGENILENLAFRTNRPKELYRQVLPVIFKKLGLPEDTKAYWSQKAGCSCGCSPGFVLQLEDGTPRDFWATVEGDDAKVELTSDAMDEAADRIDQLDRQGVLAALKSANETGAESVQKTGRGGSGKLRNFKAMAGEKFESVANAVIRENNDDEAILAVFTEAHRRGISTDVL